MKQFGELKAIAPSILLHLLSYLLTSPWIWLGVSILVTSLALYLTAISRLALSYVLPIHASSYVLNALLAWWFLGEQVSGLRWLSTLIITIGVLLVSLSRSQSLRRIERKNLKFKNKISPFLWFPFGFYLSKTWWAVIILALADSSGDVLLAMGMKKVGKVTISSWQKILATFRSVITNPLIISGISCQAIAFFVFISVLTWADISFVRPATALTYVFSLLGARYILKEIIVPERLFGIILIAIGVAIHR